MKIEVTTPPPPQPDKKWQTADMKFAVANKSLSVAGEPIIVALFDCHNAAKQFVEHCPRKSGCTKTVVDLNSGLSETYYYNYGADKWVSLT